MKLPKLLAAAAVLAVAVPAVASAQDAAPDAAQAATPDYTPSTKGLLPEVAADGCELHLWPAERMNSMTSGLLGPGLLNSAINAGKDANNKTLMASALDSPSQLDALQDVDLRGLLGFTPGTTIIRHETPLERKTMNKVKTRRADSTSKCYSELIVADVFYQKAMIYGRSLRTLFMVRKFGNDQKIDAEYKAWGGNGLSLFPPKEGEDAVAALDELVSVYKANFVEFAKNAKPKLTGTAKK
jgi:hypothetical protein